MRTVIYITRAGPGDPGLLTRWAFELIQKADIVLYDTLVSKEVMNLVSDEAELILVGTNGIEGEYDKNIDSEHCTQEKIHSLLVKL
ncbi:MAG: hypothetical protein JKX97_02510, partial [Candidatus Lindowbacteria bacterium]|nr:hypothetical protein [Candidatus Lindowbacteria bacterium]